jgi:hypothetical protein
MSKPDRFTRAVERVAHGPRHYRNVFHDDAIRLLRRQFAAIRRVVKAEHLQDPQPCADDTAYDQAIDDVLRALDAWRKGQP